MYQLQKGVQMIFKIPGFGDIDIKYLVFDLNGTLAIDGIISDQVQQYIVSLKHDYDIIIISRDIHNNVKELADKLGVNHVKISSDLPASEQKAHFVRSIGGESVIAIGNGNSDVDMFKESAIAIAVLGPEGACSDCIAEADLVVTNILYAFECIKTPSRLIATLQN